MPRQLGRNTSRRLTFTLSLIFAFSLWGLSGLMSKLSHQNDGEHLSFLPPVQQDELSSSHDKQYGRAKNETDDREHQFTKAKAIYLSPHHRDSSVAKTTLSPQSRQEIKMMTSSYPEKDKTQLGEEDSHAELKNSKLELTTQPNLFHSSNKTTRIKKRLISTDKWDNHNATLFLPWSLPPESIHRRVVNSTTFMNELAELKRRANITIPWEQIKPREHNNNSSLHNLVNLPKPIFTLNLPKSGTTMMHMYMACGGIGSVHTGNQAWGRIGTCMLNNFLKNAPPVQGCRHTYSINRKGKRVRNEGTVEHYSDIGLAPKSSSENSCFYSTLNEGGLEAIASAYPNATLLLLRRNPSIWVRSLRKHESYSKLGSLLQRWTKHCGFPGSLEDGNTFQNWVNFYESHTEKVRQFVKSHLHLTYIEAELEDENLPSYLEFYTGIKASCVKDYRPTDADVVVGKRKHRQFS